MRMSYNILLISRNKLSEIETLRCKLDEERYNNKAHEDRLMISKAQVTQLEKQLFELKLAPSNVINSYNVTQIFYQYFNNILEPRSGPSK